MIPNHVLLLHSTKQLKYLPEPTLEEILRNKMRSYMGCDILSSFSFTMFYCESNTHVVREVIEKTLHLQEIYQLKTHKEFVEHSFYWDYHSHSSKVKYLQKRLKNNQLEGFYLFILMAKE